jgi:hypothetical protein
MAKFCFKANRKDSLQFITSFYERVDVTIVINEEYPQESCLILNNLHHKDVLMRLNEELASLEGFSYPVYVPNWTTIKHIGPYFPSVNMTRRVELRSKKSNKKIYLNSEQFKYALLFVEMRAQNTPMDDVFKGNFWQDLLLHIPHLAQGNMHLDDIDWSDVKGLSKSTEIPALQHSTVEVDSVVYTATPFAVDDAFIVSSGDNRGRIYTGVRRSDVVLNLSPQYLGSVDVTSYKKIVYEPGVRWAAKWKNYKNEDVYMNILFSDLAVQAADKHIVERFEELSWNGTDDDTDGSVFSDEDSEQEVIGYDDEEEELPKRFLEDDEDIDDRDFDIDGEVLASSDFDNLDNLEKRYLPYSFVISEMEQWKYLDDACRSGFYQVANLNKVNNINLQLVADAAALAIKKNGSQVGEVNHFFINYANQRGV